MDLSFDSASSWNLSNPCNTSTYAEVPYRLPKTAFPFLLPTPKDTFMNTWLAFPYIPIKW